MKSIRRWLVRFLSEGVIFTLSVSVVRVSDAAEPLLTGCVPNLQERSDNFIYKSGIHQHESQMRQSGNPQMHSEYFVMWFCPDVINLIFEQARTPTKLNFPNKCEQRCKTHTTTVIEQPGWLLGHSQVVAKVLCSVASTFCQEFTPWSLWYSGSLQSYEIFVISFLCARWRSNSRRLFKSHGLRHLQTALYRMSSIQYSHILMLVSAKTTN